MGWTFGKKSIVVIIYGKTFDQVCEELNWVYKLSRQKWLKSRGVSSDCGRVLQDFAATRVTNGVMAVLLSWISGKKAFTLLV